MVIRILDTSVAIAWYLPESFSSQARVHRRQLVNHEARFLVPTLHFWEIANVLRTYVRRGELEAELALEVYETHLQAGLQVVDPAPDEILRNALDYQATAYDAVYITLCLQQQVPLLTAEKTTSPWVTKLGPLVECIR